MWILQQSQIVEPEYSKSVQKVLVLHDCYKPENSHENSIKIKITIEAASRIKQNKFSLIIQTGSKTKPKPKKIGPKLNVFSG